MATAKVKWNANRVAKRYQKEMTTRMTKATSYLQGQVKKKIRRGQPVRRTTGGVLVGLDPSKPGEPPKKVTGHLSRMIHRRVDVRGGTITGIVSADTPYARRLELGFTGADALGRIVNQAPRPFLRPALKESRAVLKRILGVSK